MLQYTYRTMNSSKMQRLVLASPLNIPFNFIRVILSYEEQCVSRVICKRMTESIDAGTETLKLLEDASFRVEEYEAEMLQAVKSRLLRCCNVSSIDLSWDLPHRFEYLHVREMSLLQQIHPFAKISSDLMSNWMVTTTLGTKLFNQYAPSEALTANDVLEIGLRCLVSRDVETLSLFCNIIPSDLFITHGFVFIFSIKHINDATVKACYHYMNCGSREVELCRNDNNVWVVKQISEKTDYEDLECIYCHT